MAWPNNDEVSASATTNGITAAQAFAYAARYGHVPSSAGDAQAFVAAVNGWAPLLATDPEYVFAYMTQYGNLPQIGQFTSWLRASGFADANGNLTGVAPYPGQGYPPGGGAVNPPPGGSTPNLAPGPTPGQAALSGVGTAASSTMQTATDWWRRNERTILLVGGIGGALYFGIPQALLRSFGRRR